MYSAMGKNVVFMCQMKTVGIVAYKMMFSQISSELPLFINDMIIQYLLLICIVQLLPQCTVCTPHRADRSSTAFFCIVHTTRHCTLFDSIPPPTHTHPTHTHTHSLIFMITSLPTRSLPPPPPPPPAFSTYEDAHTSTSQSNFKIILLDID